MFLSNYAFAYMCFENLYSKNKGHFILYIYLYRVCFLPETAIYYKTVLYT